MSTQNQSLRGVLCIGALKMFAKITEKPLCQSLFFNKVARSRPVTLLKKNFNTGVFEICETFKNNFFSRPPTVAAFVGSGEGRSEKCFLLIIVN